jgi:hypothetical protein
MTKDLINKSKTDLESIHFGCAKAEEAFISLTFGYFFQIQSNQRAFLKCPFKLSSGMNRKDK